MRIACQVHPEERQVGVGDRVDAGADELRPRGPEPQVGAAEGDDPRVRVGAGGDREPVGPRARADDDGSGLGTTEGVGDRNRPGSRRQRVDGAAGHDPPAGGLEVGGEGAGDRSEVDHSGRRGVEGGDPAGMRLDLAELVQIDPAQPGHPVGEAPPLQLGEPWQLRLPRRDDHLAGAAGVDAAL